MWGLMQFTRKLGKRAGRLTMHRAPHHSGVGLVFVRTVCTARLLQERRPFWFCVTRRIVGESSLPSAVGVHDGVQLRKMICDKKRK